MIDLTQLTTEDLATLKARLDGLTDTSGRSPLQPRQLHDLRLLPTKDDPRPTFFWSAESPRNAADLTRTTLYPRLMWSGDIGEEITVNSASEQASYTASGYLLVAPGTVAAPDPLDALRAALDALSPEDRALMVDAQKQDRMAALRAKLSELPEAQLEALLSGTLADVPAKRKPGRPPKAQVA